LETALKYTTALFGLLLSSLPALAGGDYPATPDPRLTPGSLCEQASTYRYPEKIRYCRRDVSAAEKRQIIERYDREFGFRIGEMDRGDFKIDHYIPLCMGGSNEPDNLWPQHESIYRYTDPLEQVACDKMAAGRLSQREAIAIIKEAKADPERAETQLRELEAL
jgi:hypothetical protein